MTQPDPEPDSIELLRRARGGDPRSLGVVLARFRPALLERIRWMMGPEARRVADSGDFLQGVFAAVLRDLDGRSPEDEEGLLRWMTAVARNDIRDSVRRRREEAFDSLSTLLAERGGTATPASHVAHQERLHRLAGALERLDEKLKTVLELRVFDDARFREIGERVGCDEAHARYLFNKALIAVSRLLPEDG